MGSVFLASCSYYAVIVQLTHVLGHDLQDKYINSLCRFTSHFYHVNRTMCPSNTTQVKNKEEKRKMYQDEEMSPAEEYDQFLFFVDVFSNSIEPIQYSISVEVVPNFLLE